MLFQGQEMLEYRQFTGKEGMDWNKLKTYAGIVTLYRDLIRLRRNWYNNTRGLRGQNLNVFHVNDSDKVIAFHRWHDGGPGDDVVVLLNFANRAYETYTLGLPRGGRWFIRFNSDWEGYSPLFDNHPGYHTEGHLGARDELPFHGNLAIGKYSALILSQG
jgi:1,4-alpha-glucan branching enzyme